MASPSAPQIRSATLEHFPLGFQPVTLRFGDGRTVLVGPNGVGKSAVLEAIEAIARSATGKGGSFSTFLPGGGSFEILMPGRGILDYQFEADLLNIDDPDDPEAPPFKEHWQETCALRTLDDKVIQLWAVQGGEVTGEGFPSVRVPLSMGLLPVSDLSSPNAEYVSSVRACFTGIRRIGAGVPRYSSRRSLWIDRKKRPLFREVYPARLAGILRTLVRWAESDKEKIDEFSGLLEQLRLPSDVQLKVGMFPGQAPKEPDEVTLTVGGDNIGVLSDGTLRVIEIIVNLMTMRPSHTLLIEEPETAIHPGLLGRLLAVIDSYAMDAHVLISTHSPYVVDWAEPEQLRFVSRHHGQTRVGMMNAQQKQIAYDYLNDEGSLGEFIFSGHMTDD